jgi:hypothetical protein
MKFLVSFLLFFASISCFANIEFSTTAQKTVLSVIDSALTKADIVGSDNPIILCLRRFKRDLATENEDLNRLLTSEAYLEVSEKIERLLGLVKEDSQLIVLRINALQSRNPDDWKALRLETFHFIGNRVVEFTENRFSKQFHGERNVEAWLKRNNKVNPNLDFASFIAGLAGQFAIAEVTASPEGN